MAKNSLIVLLILAFIGLVAANATFFTVKETEHALVLRFGNPVRTESDPGLYFKLPIAETVTYMDKRVLFLDAPTQEVITSDQKRLLVDTITEFRIENPLKVYQSVRNVRGAQMRLATTINSNSRRVLGREGLSSVLSGERADLRQNIKDSVREEAAQFGIEVVDVRIRRADLPEANSQAIFRRMQTEREREASEARAKGDEEALRIRSKADREKTVLLAEAKRDAEIIRGEGDAIAVKLFADAFSQDPEFFSFYRSMQAYSAALSKDDTTLVLSPDSEFFKFFGGDVTKKR
ncbi:MAG: HflC protein [Kordiimonas sp.]|nr:HflC protein [Kordiimonas sp.]